MINFLKLTAILFLASQAFGCASSNPVNDYSKQQYELGELIANAKDAVGFNGVVLIAKDDKIIFEEAIGNLGMQSSENLTSDYAFSPGSITKAFSTIALLQLKERNQINFEQSIGEYFPELPDWKHSITIEHLLTHSSGLPDVKYRDNMTTAQAIQDLQQLKHLKFNPGTKFDYGNNNTLLRALLIEKISGTTFEAYLQKYLFSPAGMSGAFAKSDFHHVNRKVASGAKPLALKGITAYTTARDLLKLERFLWTEKGLGKNFIKTAISKPGKGGKRRAYYDFGFYQTNASGEVTFVEHDGTYPSHYSLKRTDLANNYTLILLSNDGRKTTLNELRTAIVSYLETGNMTLPPTWRFISDIKLNGVNHAVSNLQKQINTGTAIPDEDALNEIGYDFFYDGDLIAATAILKLNYERFPQSLNAIDSYAETLLKAGQKELAKPLLKKGLKLAKKKRYRFYIHRFTEFLGEL